MLSALLLSDQHQNHHHPLGEVHRPDTNTLKMHKDHEDDCLLCGSRIELSQIPWESKKKWSVNICTLYGILDEKRVSQVEQITSSSVFCIVCYQDLREIDNLYTAIQRFNSKLQVMKMDCETKLKDIIVQTQSTIIKPNHQQLLQQQQQQQHHQMHNQVWVQHHSQHPNLQQNQNPIQLQLQPGMGESFQKFQRRSQRERLYQYFQGVDVCNVEFIHYDTNSNTADPGAGIDCDGDDGIECVEVEVDPRPEMDLIKIMENVDFVSNQGIALNNAGATAHQNPVDNVIDVEFEEGDQHQHQDEQQHELQGPQSELPQVQSQSQSQESVQLRDKRGSDKLNSQNEVTFMCLHPGCPMAFTIEARRDGHFNRVHKSDPRPYKCQKCTCSFLSYNELVEHENVHLGLTPFDCPDCELKFPTKLRLNRHRRYYHRPKGAECQYCGKAFLYAGKDLERHLMSHTGKDNDPEKILQCELCGITFRDIRILHRHLNREHPNSDALARIFTFNCRYCGKAFTRNYYLKRHERIHPEYESEGEAVEGENDEDMDLEGEPESEIQTGIERGEFKYKPVSLRQKISEKDNEEFEVLREQFNLKPLSITLKKLPMVGKPNLGSVKSKTAPGGNGGRDGKGSSRVFKVRKKYRPRQKRPNDCAKYPSTLKQLQYPFPCPYANCKSKYLVEILLEGHIKKRHLGVNRPYECEICHTTWISHNELMQHGNVHLGLTPFDCQDCDEKFATKNLLGAHRRKTHRDKEVVCEHCGKRFLYACANYRVHVQRHLNQRSYKCELCDDSFYAKAELTQHQRTYHLGEFEDVREYKCQLCDKSYSRPQFLKRHEFIEHSTSAGPRPFTGPGSRKRNSNNRYIKFPRNSPGNGRSSWKSDRTEFRCHVCGLKAEDQENLDDHLSTEHSEDEYRPFKCEVCGFAFKFFGERNRHRRVKHGLEDIQQDDSSQSHDQ